jgi:ribosomal protein S18 acetylase RimI-like enzyme
VKPVVEYRTGSAGTAQIVEHLERCDSDFNPPLSRRVDITAYARKIADNAVTFEAWTNGSLVGLVAAYCNDSATKVAHITSVSILSAQTGHGIGGELLDRCLAYARAYGMDKVSLEVGTDNARAIRMYEARGFVTRVAGTPFTRMTLILEAEDTDGQ